MEPISITAYKNDYKRGNEKAPDFKGKFKGVEIAIWKKLDKNGQTCLSALIKDAQGRGETKHKPVVPGRWNDLDAGGTRSDATGYSDLDEDIPF